MGKGFSILAWDGFGAGLVMINPRIVDDGTKDIYGNPNNWFPYNCQEEMESKLTKLTIGLEHFQIID